MFRLTKHIPKAIFKRMSAHTTKLVRWLHVHVTTWFAASCVVLQPAQIHACENPATKTRLVHVLASMRMQLTIGSVLVGFVVPVETNALASKFRRFCVTESIARERDLDLDLPRQIGHWNDLTIVISQR